MTMERRLELDISDALEGKTLKTVLTREMNLSGGLLDDLKKHADGILLDGGRARLSDTVSAGSRLSLCFRDEGECSVVPAAGEISIVYEDEDILAVSKPPRLPCHPVSGNHTETLANFLVYHYARRGQSLVPRIITRLDSGTSGLVLVAKNALSGSLLGSAAAAGGLKKEYLAVTEGVPQRERGEINAPIRRVSGNALKREVCPDGEGQAAVTHFEVLAQNGALALLRVTPQTGRTHQIRVHLASIGCPLAGDFLYGREDETLISRTALHMQALSLIHPVTGQSLHLFAPAPPDMQDLISKL